MSWPEDLPSGPTQQSCKAKLRITHPKVTVPAMSRWCCPPPVIKTKTTPQSHTISRALLQTTKALQKRIKTDKEVSMVIGKFTLYSPTQYTLYLNDPAGLQHLWYISSKNTWAVHLKAQRKIMIQTDSNSTCGPQETSPRNYHPETMGDPRSEILRMRNMINMMCKYVKAGDYLYNQGFQVESQRPRRQVTDARIGRSVFNPLLHMSSQRCSGHQYKNIYIVRFNKGKPDPRRISISIWSK